VRDVVYVDDVDIDITAHARVTFSRNSPRGQLGHC
jgi:hypothetical protein